MTSDVQTARDGTRTRRPEPATDRPTAALPAGGMATVLRHTWFLTRRRITAVLRQPAFVAITLVQPIIWLLLFGNLFRNVVQLPGFQGGSYISYLTPGVVVMTALFSATWTGMSYIEEMNTGLFGRLLSSPVRRGAILGGDLVNTILVGLVQSGIMIGIAYADGAHFTSGAVGMVTLVGASALLGAAISALSIALALTMRQRESVIAASQFVAMPMTFLSTAFMPNNLTPGWVQAISHANPLNWGIRAGSAALNGEGPGVVLPQLGYLLAFAVIAYAVSLLAFRGYRRSL